MHCILDFDGRRLFGARPFAVFESRGSGFEMRGSRLGVSRNIGALEALRVALAEAKKLFPQGGAIGFFSYDFARTLEPRAFSPNSPPDDLQIPDIRLTFYEELASWTLDVRRSSLNVPEPASGLLSSAYSQAIARIKNYIAEGDIYQANYAERFSFPLPCPPSQLYAHLQRTHAAPFSALLEYDDFAIVSNSPERFLKLENRVLTSQPIKGTMRRGSTPDEDAEKKNALQNSAKNRAENVMIVDLLRNDFGRVCEYGSVEVPQLFEVQTFPTLHHLVSTISGVLKPKCGGLDALVATFPCGSITGAPKIRAMQIIDELENTRRGASFGAIGYFGFGGDMEWNVAIRTITIKNQAAHFHAGGGIVADSEADDEYSEMQLKARALRQILTRNDAENPL